MAGVITIVSIMIIFLCFVLQICGLDYFLKGVFKYTIATDGKCYFLHRYLWSVPCGYYKGDYIEGWGACITCFDSFDDAESHLVNMRTYIKPNTRKVDVW